MEQNSRQSHLPFEIPDLDTEQAMDFLEGRNAMFHAGRGGFDLRPTPAHFGTMKAAVQRSRAFTSDKTLLAENVGEVYPRTLNDMEANMVEMGASREVGQPSWHWKSETHPKIFEQKRGRLNEMIQGVAAGKFGVQYTNAVEDKGNTSLLTSPNNMKVAGRVPTEWLDNGTYGDGRVVRGLKFRSGEWE